MSLLDLKSMISVEDFADAHEPLNDGVKTVPNAQTVASGVKTADVGKDTTTQGPAKVVPEKKDTDDQTKTEHSVVKETAERSGTKLDVEAESIEDDLKEPAKVEEPLAHSTEKATKEDLDKTDKAKTSLEAFLPKAKTFDVIGYPKVQGGRVGKMVDYLYRRAGRKAPATLSLESITTAVELGQHRLSKLERDMRRHQRSSRGNMTFSIEGYTLPTHNQLLRISMEEAEKIESDSNGESGVKRMLLKLMAIIRRLIKKGREMFDRATQGIRSQIEKARETLKQFINGEPRKVQFSALLHTLFVKDGEIDLNIGKKYLSDIEAKAKEVNMVLRNRLKGGLLDMGDAIRNMVFKVEDLTTELHEQVTALHVDKQSVAVTMDRTKAKELSKILDDVEAVLKISTYEAMDKPDFLNVEQAMTPDTSNEDIAAVKGAQQDLVEAVENFTRAMYSYVARISKGISAIDADTNETRKDKTASNESFMVPAETIVEDMEQPIVVAEPTAHDVPPMDPVDAAVLTEIETDPLDVPMLEINRVQETIEVLSNGIAAVEQYRQIYLNNPRMSKQAASVLHAGLEHIDRTCNLKIRATGMESYLTTPRSAMEEAEVNEKSLLDRAGEIGAKILKWLRELMIKARATWGKYSSGISKVQSNLEKLIPEVGKLPSEAGFTEFGSSSIIDSFLFLEGKWAGTEVTQNERDVLDEINKSVDDLIKNIAKPILAKIRKGSVDEGTIDAVHSILASHEIDKYTEDTIPMPGGWVFKRKGPSIDIDQSGDNGAVGGASVPVEPISMYNTGIRKTAEFAGMLASDVQITKIININDQISKALVDMRKRAGKEVDESQFQRLQNTIARLTEKYINLDKYFSLMRNLARIQHGRAKFYEMLVKSWGKLDRAEDME